MDSPAVKNLHHQWQNWRLKNRMASASSRATDRSESRSRWHPSSFVVEGHTPGVTVPSKNGKLGNIKAGDTVALHFDNVRVPYENLLSGAGECARKYPQRAGAMKTFDAIPSGCRCQRCWRARAAVEFTTNVSLKRIIVPDYTKSLLK